MSLMGELEKVIDEIIQKDKNRLNFMLSPEPIECDIELRTSTINFSMKDWEKNQREEIHGGAIAAMFDTAMGATAAAFDYGKDVTTAALQVSYIRPMTKSKYSFVSEVTNLGKTLIRVGSKAVDLETSKIVAISTATYVPYKSK